MTTSIPLHRSYLTITRANCQVVLTNFLTSATTDIVLIFATLAQILHGGRGFELCAGFHDVLYVRVGVRIHGRRDVCMPEYRLDRFRVDTGIIQRRCLRMAEDMTTCSM